MNYRSCYSSPYDLKIIPVNFNLIDLTVVNIIERSSAIEVKWISCMYLKIKIIGYWSQNFSMNKFPWKNHYTV
jgi:hypothetical protein